MNGFSINTCIVVTLYGNMLTFRVSDKSFKLDVDLLEAMTNFDFNFSYSNPEDQQIIYECGKK